MCLPQTFYTSFLNSEVDRRGPLDAWCVAEIRLGFVGLLREVEPLLHIRVQLVHLVLENGIIRQMIGFIRLRVRVGSTLLPRQLLILDQGLNWYM